MRTRAYDAWSLPVPGWGRVSGLDSGPAGETMPTLLLLHGFTGASDAWGEPLLAALGARFRVVAVDLPGHGGSGLPDDRAWLTVPGVAGMLAELLPRLSVSRAVWVGYSMGGRVALASGVLHPGRVAALVLESTTPGLESPAARAERRAADEDRARSLEEGGIEAFVDAWLGGPLFQGLRRLPPGEQEEERARRLRNRPGALAAVLRGMGTGSQPWFGEDLHRVRVPCLLLAGAEDPRFLEEARFMASRLPAATLNEFTGAGHVLHRETPAAWLTAVVRFLLRTSHLEST
jgi:2-succinyl-6-hydroxy-2,4-cyclohexadiene-1-carboxylate synthase